TGAFLARAGRRVLLFEREQFPRFHVGESLLPATVPILDRLGALPRGLPDRVAPWLAKLRQREGYARGKLDELAATDDRPISHYRWARGVAAAVTRDPIVVGDGGAVVTCAAKFVPVARPGQWVDPGPLGCLGVGPP